MVLVAGWELRANRCHRFEPRQQLETTLVMPESISSPVLVRFISMYV